ncbi:biotin transporter BioY [Bacillus alkalicellulosilyticus]|uniref:biotin transporter BioY n=1 Tax=Alkalihalobacterium alkalicellulosilyticum TaxID=1912214 RepID=UPI0009969F87|nr:biotin transporter BioY [Bacillus alkalicellulosilyticus]
MKLQNMMYASLFVAVIAALGILPQIILPFSPVPITAQSLGVMLAGAVLGARYGGLSLVIFVLLVGFGAPLLAGGRGGFSVLIGPGAGYILSWPIAAFLIGFLVEKYWHKLNLVKLIAFNILGGIVLVYACGITYLSFVTELSWAAAAITNLAYIPGDLIKVTIASIVALQIKKAYPLIKKESIDTNIAA